MRHLELVAGVKVKQDEMHRVEWELRKRIKEIEALKQTNEETKQALHYERRKVITLNHELDQMNFKVSH